MKILSQSARSIATILILLVGLSGLPGCNDSSSAPKDAATDPAVAAARKAGEEAAAKKAGSKAVKSIKNLGQ
jgi:hypothetical protein